MAVLGIETSCDETAVALYCPHRGIIAHEVKTQQLHAPFGGVVPELASRDHIRVLLPLVDRALTSAELLSHQVTAVAYTKGPGLIGALMVGAALGRALSYAWQVPAIGVHHMEAHLMAAFLESSAPEYPFVALLVSGGHTMLVAVESFGVYRLLGESVDDAAGEAFDKTAKVLGLAYPGGPQLAELAAHGDPERYQFTRPMLRHRSLDMSFSGLKTQVAQAVIGKDLSPTDKADVARGFEEAVVDILLTKSAAALTQTGYSRLVMVGGVSANKRLRAQCASRIDAAVYYPRTAYCTDNGAMVAYAGYCRLKNKMGESLAITVRPRWPLENLNL